MTAGYDPLHPARQDFAAPEVPLPPRESVSERTGQLPPWAEGDAAQSATAPYRQLPAQHVPGHESPYPPLGQPYAAGPPAPAGPSTGHFAGPSTGSIPVSAPTGQLPVSAPTGFGAAGPYDSGRQHRPGARGGSVALGIALVALLLAGAQTVLLFTVNSRLDQANRRAAAAQKAADDRATALEQRTGSLEQKAGNTLDAQAVAADVLPSVFRLTAGEFAGTAFMIGKAPGQGQDALTNYHVVDGVYKTGGRQVALERDNKRYTATIVKVDPGKDLALLRVNNSFGVLVAAPTVPKPGEQVVVVGAPLGLEATVTTGVVSQIRDTGQGTFLQNSAPINPGNSGGPVLNSQRQVVGIASAKLPEAEGLSLAIPISVACQTFSVC